jgi:purine-nucleoside phosphorylase
MDRYLTRINTIAGMIRGKIQGQPRVAIILGTGFGELAEVINIQTILPYQEIQDWPVSTVLGHAGRLIIGNWNNQSVIIMQGRVHYYEGYSMAEVTLPVRVMQRLGVEILVVTNAAGAINPGYSPGDIMLISDHLGLASMTGLNPLIGPNLDEFGPRFPDMSQAYDRRLGEFAKAVAASESIDLKEGVYVGLSGPSFETPADLRFLKMAGADAVGMSTVPEVIVARHGGTRVLGFSGISNKANLDGSTLTTHEEVLAAGRLLVPKFEKIIGGVLKVI